MTEKQIGQLEVGDYVMHFGRGQIASIAEVTKVLKTQLVIKLAGGQEVKINRQSGKQLGTSGWGSIWWNHCESPDKFHKENARIRAEQKALADARLATELVKRTECEMANKDVKFEILPSNLMAINFSNSRGTKLTAIFAQKSETMYNRDFSGKYEGISLDAQIYGDLHGSVGWSSPGRIEGKDLRSAVHELFFRYW